jgi:predicted nucleic acid-binding protein
LVKLVIDEDGSELAAELWNSVYAAVSSILSYVEGRAALAAARRGNRLTAKGHTRALAEFEEVQGGLVLIGVDEPLTRQAGELAEENGLRGYDAVHLSTALDLGGEDIVVVTWDADLSRAAEGCGLAVAGTQPW